MYTTRNFKTKKALKESVANGEPITIFQPGPFGDNIPTSGRVYLEGPHYPEPHRWYATADLEDGLVVKVSGRMVTGS